jgi:hypothetical protein
MKYIIYDRNTCPHRKLYLYLFNFLFSRTTSSAKRVNTEVGMAIDHHLNVYSQII